MNASISMPWLNRIECTVLFVAACSWAPSHEPEERREAAHPPPVSSPQMNVPSPIPSGERPKLVGRRADPLVFVHEGKMVSYMSCEDSRAYLRALPPGVPGSDPLTKPTLVEHAWMDRAPTFDADELEGFDLLSQYIAAHGFKFCSDGTACTCQVEFYVCADGLPATRPRRIALRGDCDVGKLMDAVQKIRLLPPADRNGERRPVRVRLRLKKK